MLTMLTILIVSLLSASPDPLDKIRKGKDQHSKTLRIMAYGFGACQFAHQINRYRYESDFKHSVRARDLLPIYQEALRNASKLAKRDTDEGIPCAGQEFGLMMQCFSAVRLHGLQDAPTCPDHDAELAATLAIADLPELRR